MNNYGENWRTLFFSRKARPSHTVYAYGAASLGNSFQKDKLKPTEPSWRLTARKTVLIGLSLEFFLRDWEKIHRGTHHATGLLG